MFAALSLAILETLYYIRYFYSM
uniref:Uncharacterized protein n=1 Tax=Rhizophora mucronata TaxID=61149 RepID=A0A2P2QX68_RHIMU